LSISKEFVIQRDGKSFVLFAGLLTEAHQQGLTRVTTTLVQIPNDSNGNVAICHATVETAKGTFDGIGDASPTNVGRAIVPHLIRMSETRAVARAFRVAVNVGEALADDPSDDAPEASDAPRTGERERRQTPGTHQSRPGPEASPRQWFDYLAVLARDYRIAVPPTPGPGVTDEQIVEENKRLKAAIQAGQQARQGGE
jgi:hypothetical protein